MAGKRHCAAVRRITAPTRVAIRELVDALKEFLPLSTQSRKAVTFTSIFARHGVADCLEGPSKARALQHAWEEIVRRHPRLPYTLIREVVPAAVSYRRYKRNPLTAAELNRLIDCLNRLGIDMKRELAAIELDETIPQITVPPSELQQRLREHPLVEGISSEPCMLFGNGHFNEAVRKAAERFEVQVQTQSGLTDIGKDLMAKAFRLSAPAVPLNGLSTENEKGIQEGYMHLTMGMTRAIRNIFSHGDEDQRSPEEAYEMLIFINWLFRQLPSANNQ